ncbi:hypothetical protein CFOL_v3_14207 [Cephalotus follicularis]|uniref:Uncharacterized protein n=1 Tax=Cephalotus follicularis TaxID=3775 RepID=A0A1Q3BS38_CEPFO|nr:hypothetical protein CFOL_v3_14207 [Cephalotus follicularis]
MDSFPDLYPLTSLQIGDIKSSLSWSCLYFAPISQKFLILIDNQSWRKNKHSRLTRIRELMTTKYRTSPFQNSRMLLRSPSFGYRSSTCESKNSCKWFPIINMATLREKAPFSMMNLYKTLHGFIVFEVAWKDVRGINYLNELQTDGSVALEVKSVRKWEFNDIGQALSSMSSWFSGTPSETQTLQSNLILLQDRVPSCSSRGITVASNELLLNDASQAELFSEDMFFDVRECLIDTKGTLLVDHQTQGQSRLRILQNIQGDNNMEPVDYDNTLLLFRFNDRDLPFKLRQIITSDMKLLSLLESGLPSWVIFLQSYPLFCKVYRHWMRPLLTALYVVISLITLIIGFYDLYKNVPMLKATVSHLCGPLFKWIEAWDMVSRVKYLGTMLFLQNLEKAVKWLLTMTQIIKLTVLLITRPLMHPLIEMMEFILPIWNFFAEAGEQLCITAWIVLEPLGSMVFHVVEVLLSPLELLYSLIQILVTLICSWFNSIWELVLFPTRVCLVLANYVASLFADIYEVLERAFMISVNSTRQLTYLARVKPDSSEISFWHSLWNDLLSKVFRSLRNVIHGLVTFSTSCKRHRYSIYNHLRAIFWQLCHLLKLTPSSPCHQVPKVGFPVEVDVKGCDHCKQE